MRTQHICDLESRSNHPLTVKGASSASREIDAQFEPDFEPRTPSSARDAGPMLASNLAPHAAFDHQEQGGAQ